MPERTDIALPAWMDPAARPQNWDRLPDGLVCLVPRSGARAAARRATGQFAKLIADVLSADEASSRPGLLQGIDARLKVVGLIGLIVVTTLLHSISALVAACGLCGALAVISRAPARRLAGVWVMVPLFSVAIMLPATLNVVTDGRPVLVLWRFTADRFGPWSLPAALSVTDAGLLVAARVVLRTLACVSFAALLTSTTPSSKLFRGLRMLGVPQMFVMLLSMMQRYLGVIARAAEQIHLAKLSRSIAPGTIRQEQAWVAAGMGSLFRRTYSLSSQVYLAMLSRGYTGEAHLLEDPRLHARDWLFLAACAAAGSALFVIR